MAEPEQFGASGYLPAGDAVEIFYRFWEPESIRAGVLAFHSLAGHGEWFESLATNLLPRGFATLAPDLRGHGMTRWDLGRLPPAEILLEDGRLFCREFFRRNPGRPLFLLGSGVGGCLAVLLAAGGIAGVDGLILLSPVLDPTYIGWKEKARMLAALLFGREEGAATPLGRGLPLCGDRLRLEWIRKDPLALVWLPARTHWNARSAIRRARRDLSRVRLPILCVQGGKDPVTDPRTNRRLLERHPESRVVLWEGAFHELVLELDSEYLAGVLSDWMRHQGAEGEAKSGPQGSAAALS